MGAQTGRLQAPLVKPEQEGHAEVAHPGTPGAELAPDPEVVDPFRADRVQFPVELLIVGLLKQRQPFVAGFKEAAIALLLLRRDFEAQI